MASIRLRACTGSIAAALAVCLGWPPAGALADAARPTIVVIMSDDEDLAAHAFIVD